jgi:hypothetical protein
MFTVMLAVTEQGEFVAAYRMTINKTSCSDASDKNLAECGRAQNYYSVNGSLLVLPLFEKHRLGCGV